MLLVMVSVTGMLLCFALAGLKICLRDVSPMLVMIVLWLLERGSSDPGLVVLFGMYQHCKSK